MSYKTEFAAKISALAENGVKYAVINKNYYFLAI